MKARRRMWRRRGRSSRPEPGVRSDPRPERRPGGGPSEADGASAKYPRPRDLGRTFSVVDPGQTGARRRSTRLMPDGERSTSTGEAKVRGIFEPVGASGRPVEPRRAGLKTLRRRSEVGRPFDPQGDPANGVDRPMGRHPRFAARGGFHARGVVRGNQVRNLQGWPSVPLGLRSSMRAAAGRPPALPTALAIVSGRILGGGGRFHRRNRSRQSLRPPADDGPDQGGQCHPSRQPPRPGLEECRFQAVDVSRSDRSSRSLQYRRGTRPPLSRWDRQAPRRRV